MARANIKALACKFNGEWFSALEESYKCLKETNRIYVPSHERLIAFNAWIQHVLRDRCDPDSLQFFLETQTDLIASHMLALLGSWRAGLIMLRSALENAVAGVYYKDHPVEMKLWIQGKFKIAVRDLIDYCCDHPDITSVRLAKLLRSQSKEEYALLSLAVHAGATSFRFSENENDLWSLDKIKYSKWNTRSRETNRVLQLILLLHFGDAIKGAKQRELRKCLGRIFPKRRRALIKSELLVNLDVT